MFIICLSLSESSGALALCGWFVALSSTSRPLLPIQISGNQSQAPLTVKDEQQRSRGVRRNFGKMWKSQDSFWLHRAEIGGMGWAQKYPMRIPKDKTSFFSFSSAFSLWSITKPSQRGISELSMLPELEPLCRLEHVCSSSFLAPQVHPQNHRFYPCLRCLCLRNKCPCTFHL